MAQLAITELADRSRAFWPDNHIPRAVGSTVLARIKALEPGQKMQDLPIELWHDSFRRYVLEDPDRKGGPNLRLIRLSPDRPSLTVTGYVFNKFVHPTEDRFITPREAARLQDISDDFRFAGSLTSVQRQVGNAVPVRLAKAVFDSVMDRASKNMRFPKEFGVVSLFTGVGGLEMGLRSAVQNLPGVKAHLVRSIEIDADCCETLALNGISTDEPTDISKRKAREIIKNPDDVAMVIGGPPCQAFSQAGRQRADSDDRGKLVFEFLRFVEEIRPIYFVMENVSNLKGVGKGRIFSEIFSESVRMGYCATAYKLLAADFGTPQLRTRWFFIGVKDSSRPVPSPVPSHSEFGSEIEGLRRWSTVGEAFTGLPEPSYR